MAQSTTGLDDEKQSLPIQQCKEVEGEKQGIGQTEEDEKEGTALPVTTRLMLSSELLGGEAGLTFGQLYAIPNLQILGVPFSLVSLTGFISGPTAILLLPLMGWVSDKGTNPRRRKMCMVVLATLILASGAATVIAANLVHDDYCLTRLQSDILERNPATTNSGDDLLSGVQNARDTPATNLATTNTSEDMPGSQVIVGKINNGLANLRERFSSENESASLTNASIFKQGLKIPATSASKHSFDLSTECFSATAVTAMVGYIQIELGYDCTMYSVKTWMLTCSPPSASGPTLVAGLVMASFGGMMTAGLGMLNLASVLGLSTEHLSGLTIQTTVQVSAVIITLLVGMTLSLLIGHRHLKCLDSKEIHQDHPPLDDLQNDGKKSQINEIDAGDLPNSPRYLETGASSTGEPQDFSEPHPNTSSNSGLSPDRPIDSKNPQEHSEAVPEHRRRRRLALKSSRTVATYGTLGTTPTSQKAKPTMDLSDSDHDKKTHTSQQSLLSGNLKQISFSCQRMLGFRTTIAVLCVSTYFGIGAISLSVLMISDYVGKAIYHGDPAAPADSDALARYQEGLQVSSYGFLVSYAVYLAFSVAQQPVLSCLGYTLEFVIMSVVLAVGLIVLSLTASVETFFLLSVISGIHKAMFHVVPISVLSNLVHAEAQRRGDGKGLQLGMAVSLITVNLPLAYCTLYPWVGSVTELTGILATPLLLAAVYVCVSAALFFVLGF